MLGQESPVGSHVSTGLGTMLLGVSGNCDDREVTSLPDELPSEPDSENDTYRRVRGTVGNQYRLIFDCCQHAETSLIYSCGPSLTK